MELIYEYNEIVYDKRYYDIQSDLYFEVTNQTGFNLFTPTCEFFGEFLGIGYIFSCNHIETI